jgi:hypothetical protein
LDFTIALRTRDSVSRGRPDWFDRPEGDVNHHDVDTPARLRSEDHEQSCAMAPRRRVGTTRRILARSPILDTRPCVMPIGQRAGV